MKIVVIGAGAVGGYFGAELCRAGRDVTFLARGAHGDAIRKRGITIEGPEGTWNEPVAVGDPSQPRRADLVLIAVKSKDLPDAVQTAKSQLAPDGIVVPLLNGIDSEAACAEALGADHVVGGIAQIASEIVEPGKLRVREHARIVVAPLTGEDPAKAQTLAERLTASGIRCRAARDLDRLLWGKLLWNAPFNAVCAITGLSAGGVLAVAELEALIRGAMGEVVRIAQARGVALSDDAIEGTLEATRSRFGNTIPSMLQDVRAGRPTEVSSLQGAIVRMGRELGCPVPLHETFVALLRGIEASWTRGSDRPQ